MDYLYGIQNPTNVIDQHRNSNALQQSAILPAPGQYFIGGFSAFERSVDDYKILLKEVSSCGKTDDKENGQLLCMKLLERELSNALTIQNASCVLWKDHTKDKSGKLVPKLNEELLCAIFTQAKHEFPGFTDFVVGS